MESTQKEAQTHDLNIAWDMLVKIFSVAILWALVIMNTELLIRWNHFAPPAGSQSMWQFGQVRRVSLRSFCICAHRSLDWQVLPMFLIILPLSSTLSAFRQHGLRQVKASSRQHARVP